MNDDTHQFLYWRYRDGCVLIGRQRERDEYAFLSSASESGSHMHDVTVFRAWCRAFLRPASVHQGAPISLAMHRVLREAMSFINQCAKKWDEDNPDLARMAWWLLPEHIRNDATVPGSPAWVRCQSVHMHRLQCKHLVGDGLDPDVHWLCVSNLKPRLHNLCDCTWKCFDGCAVSIC